MDSLTFICRALVRVILLCLIASSSRVWKLMDAVCFADIQHVLLWVQQCQPVVHQGEPVCQDRYYCCWWEFHTGTHIHKHTDTALCTQTQHEIRKDSQMALLLKYIITWMWPVLICPPSLKERKRWRLYAGSLVLCFLWEFYINFSIKQFFQ